MECIVVIVGTDAIVGMYDIETEAHCCNSGN